MCVFKEMKAIHRMKNSVGFGSNDFRKTKVWFQTRNWTEIPQKNSDWAGPHISRLCDLHSMSEKFGVLLFSLLFSFQMLLNVCFSISSSEPFCCWSKCDTIQTNVYSTKTRKKTNRESSLFFLKIQRPIAQKTQHGKKGWKLSNDRRTWRRKEEKKALKKPHPGKKNNISNNLNSSMHLVWGECNWKGSAKKNRAAKEKNLLSHTQTHRLPRQKYWKNNSNFCVSIMHEYHCIHKISLYT